MNISRASASLLAVAALSLIAACGGGGGGGGTVTPPGGGGGGTLPTPTPVPTATPVALPASIDGMACAQVTEGTSYPQDKFSQHIFVGIIANGSWKALPQGLGMYKPVAPTAGTPSHPDNTYEIENNTCEYNVHTHDYSGLVHIEDLGVSQGTTFPAYATLQSLLDVSGITLSAAGLTIGNNTLSGAVTVYTGTPSGTDGNGNDVVTTYKQFGTGTAFPTDHSRNVSGELNFQNGDMSWYTSGTATWATSAGDPSTGVPASNPSYASLKFTRHMAIWIVIGTPPAAGLWPVTFVISN